MSTTCLRSAWLPLGFCLSLTVGCSGSVEERTISWSEDGGTVAFQHGEDGVYVASKDGTELEKIHQPEQGELANSTPLWAPNDDRLIFTTAHVANDDVDRSPAQEWSDNPEGREFGSQAITYTCWIRDEATDDQTPEPRRLFTENISDIGYVAAGLAVRWSPDGKQIWHVRQLNEKNVGLFVYDLQSKRVTREENISVNALLFDWSPNGEYLTCVTLVSEEAFPLAISVRAHDATDWWQVPGQVGDLTPGIPLEQLRASRPIWHKNGSQFAFLTSVPRQEEDDTPTKRIIRSANVSDQTISTVEISNDEISDMHWSPTEKTLGFRTGNEPGELHLLSLDSSLTEPEQLPVGPNVNSHPVRRFAGWDSSGKHLAYVSPETEDPVAGKWAIVFPRNAFARDRVILADNLGESEEAVFDGMRVTFPRWSPSERKLSLWFTFQPTHSTWVQRMMNWGMPNGDPAAVFDLDTRQISWLAISGEEKIQIGHYHAIHGDYEQAWKWYQEASKEVPPPAARTMEQFAQRMVEPTNSEIFKYYCLTKLDRPDEAQKHLELFRKTFYPAATSEAQSAAAAVETEDDSTENDANPQTAIMKAIVGTGDGVEVAVRDMYAAQAILSVGGVKNTRPFFETPRPADDAVGELSRRTILAQLMLLEGDYEGYARFASESLLPAFISMADLKGLTVETFRDHKPHESTDESSGDSPVNVLMINGVFSLLPICSLEFMSELPRDSVDELIVQCRTLTAENRYEPASVLIDLILRAAYTNQHRVDELAETNERLTQAGVSLDLQPIESCFEAFASLEFGIIGAVRSRPVDRLPE
jgi:Tol biopolymer transport system component